MKFTARCYALFCQLVMTAVITTVAIVGLIHSVHLAMAPEYETADHALYYCAGDQNSTMMDGLIGHMLDRGYPIKRIDVFEHRWPEGVENIPCIMFFRCDGSEIVESRMYVFWTKGNLLARFGRI